MPFGVSIIVVPLRLFRAISNQLTLIFLVFMSFLFWMWISNI